MAKLLMGKEGENLQEARPQGPSAPHLLEVGSLGWRVMEPRQCAEASHKPRFIWLSQFLRDVRSIYYLCFPEGETGLRS